MPATAWPTVSAAPHGDPAFRDDSRPQGHEWGTVDAKRGHALPAVRLGLAKKGKPGSILEPILGPRNDEGRSRGPKSLNRLASPGGFEPPLPP